jgi:hypothetical protein
MVLFFDDDDYINQSEPAQRVGLQDRDYRSLSNASS